MIIHTGVAGSAPILIVYPIWHMNAVFWIPVFTGKPKVDDVYHISKLANSHQEIIRLDIAMDERFMVDVFDARD
jgi:hypothetical protein